ncbi:MAG: hypothetical protein UR62_C0005G0033 [Candidatus Nomurabacteria bacterium GW2011_GWF2_35_12]|uniref:Uncharacterized protein n=3 Tax=Candidatus Nomuraibacteriota TaxID=1752729 RepID=A0A0G0GEM5_9BACT|nr:MAG: hypothetical protein UR62_C0005G0033 [Candidatus Nomurabacteria bacterium GW2011_GWF2_35_12]KKP72215.1 MAG: hypothetical protein UR70_C0012G0026 [Candidatus Nomurabacteria bacterium GW2011_GWB1_35_20]KKP75113.1 MAG: hypothetical protein UR72_C0006G0009 [Parcubacteria group bacterium GW2011_GWC1_35_21]KKP78234.1 MAG: hypothetical protein UR77_C0005G0009 [Candidatus Nomurabacteria bacterium GW2011_GWC2_35_35]KKP88129.1 MAG: hypothetical protein UR92_C0012G0007 [Candidatus Nomurabacteria b
MKVSIDRIVWIIAYMYGKNAEVVIDISKEECHLFLGINRTQISLSYDEVDCLINNEIIELDSGSNEEGHETQVYRLTENSQERIKAIIKNKKVLLSKE